MIAPVNREALQGTGVSPAHNPEFVDKVDEIISGLNAVASGAVPVSASVDPSAAAPVAPLFNSFREAWDYLSGYEGFRVLTLLDDVTVAPGTYSGGKGLRIAGDISRDTTLTVPEGVVFEGLRQMTYRVKVLFTGTSPPVSDFTGDAFAGQPDIFYLEKGCAVDCSGSGPFFRISGDGTPQSAFGGLALNFTQDIGGASATPVFEATDGAFGFFFMLAGSSLAAGSLATDAVSAIALQLSADSSTSRNPSDYPAILGGFFAELSARADLVLYDPFLNASGLTSENVQGALDEVAETGAAFGGYLGVSVPITPTGVPVLVNPTVQSASFDPSSYSWAPNTNVSVLRDGKYEITYGAVYINTGTGTRFVQLDLLVNGLAQPGLEVTTSVEGSGFTPVNGITRTAILDLVGGDSIGLAATRLNGAATVATVTNEVFLSIRKVR